MEREKVIELASQSGMNPNRNDKAINALFSSVPVHWLEHFARLVEQETLERAAKVCQDKAMSMEKEACDAEFEDDAISLRSSAWLISVCGNEIRNLKP